MDAAVDAGRTAVPEKTSTIAPGGAFFYLHFILLLMPLFRFLFLSGGLISMVDEVLLFVCFVIRLVAQHATKNSQIGRSLKVAQQRRGSRRM